ncbi:MAG TPA: glycosyltransferase family 4 protein [Geobacteraceae bacterium]
MKIVLTTHLFLPDFFAGTEILTFETARELKRLGHEVHVVTGFPGRNDLPDEERFDRYEYDGIPVERFHYAPVPMGEQWNANEAEFNNRFFARHFRAYLEDLKPDVVHFFHLGRLSASAIDVCHDLGIPAVMTPTDFWLICPTFQLRLTDNSICPGPDRFGVKCLRHVAAISQPTAKRAILECLPDRLVEILMMANGIAARRRGRPPVPFLEAYATRQAFLRERMNLLDRMIVPTRLMERILVEHGLSPAKVHFSRYGIDTSHIAPRVKGGGGGVLRIGFIGTLYDPKGAHVLVEAVRSLGRDVPCEVKMYGDPGLFPEYVEKLKRLMAGDPRMTLCGTFAKERIGEVFEGIDVLVVPSVWYENTPLVIYAAQAAACPVIASDLGGMAEVVSHGVNGLLFEAGDAAGLAAALKKLIDDRQELRRLSEHARRPKTIARYVEELLAIYDDVMASKGRQRFA